MYKYIAVALLATVSASAWATDYVTGVADIINNNCVVCHRAGGIGPMSFETYDQVRPWAPLMAIKVMKREMPPYAYDHGVGIQKLQGDWRLSQEDIDTFVEWVDTGSMYGNTEIVVQPVVFPNDNEWSFAQDFGEPDLIIASTPIDIPAEGADLWHKHYVPAGNEVPRCIKAVQVKPRGDAKAVVHHANSSVFLTNEDTGELERYGQLTEYAMGKWGEIPGDGVCRTLPADSQILWDIHMYPGGVGATAQGLAVKDNVVEIGLWFHEVGYEEESFKQDLALYPLRDGYENGHLIIPPNGYAMTQGFKSFDHPVRVDSFQPHGHLRMNAASLEIFYPESGRTEKIGQVSNWSATWHHSHLFDPDVAPLVPAGAVLVMKQWYDNTANNPNNPDPDMWVVDGSRTGDEMSHFWIAVTHLDDEGYDKLKEERNEKVNIASK